MIRAYSSGSLPSAGRAGEGGQHLTTVLSIAAHFEFPDTFGKPAVAHSIGDVNDK